MKTLISTCFSIALASYLLADSESVTVVGATESGVEVKATCSRKFADNKDVIITLEIVNHSAEEIRSIRSNGFEDIQITLSGPDGDQILGYHEIEGTRIQRGMYKRRIIDKIESNGNKLGDSIRLSNYWPLQKTGEYSCVLIKRIYSGIRKDESDLGVPVDIKLPEIRFIIESIDKSFVPPAASLIDSKHTRRGDKNPDAKNLNSLLTIVVVSLLVPLLMVLGLRFFRRAN